MVGSSWTMPSCWIQMVGCISCCPMQEAGYCPRCGETQEPTSPHIDGMTFFISLFQHLCQRSSALIIIPLSRAWYDLAWWLIRGCQIRQGQRHLHEESPDTVRQLRGVANLADLTAGPYRPTADKDTSWETPVTPLMKAALPTKHVKIEFHLTHVQKFGVTDTLLH